MSLFSRVVVTGLFGAVLLGGSGGEGIGARTAMAQCPTDYTLTFNDRPDDIPDFRGGLVTTAMTLFDPDGNGPQAPIYIMAVHTRGYDRFSQVTTEYSRIDRWSDASQTWVPLSGVLGGIINCFAQFDEDGAGPNPPRLYIGGRFSDFGLAGGATVNCPNIMRYDGTNFSAVRGGLNGEVHTMLVFDDDATGPILPKLYVGGNFGAANSSGAQGTVNAGRLIRLTTGGLLWENPSASFDDRVFALCSFDEDGPGGVIPRLAVGGAFSSNNGNGNQKLVAIYNSVGGTWSSLNQGLDTMISFAGSGRRVFSVCEFDEDGTGPLPPSLFVGGSIYQTQGGGVVSPLVIRWRRNPATGIPGWIAVAPAANLVSQPGSDSCFNMCSNTPMEGTRPRVLCMIPFDIDGAGPLPAELYIGGAISGIDVAGMMKWNATSGSLWLLGDSGRDFHYAPGIDSSSEFSYFPDTCTTLMTLPGTGSVPPRLIAGAAVGYVDLITQGIFHWVTATPRFLSTTYSSGGVGPSVSNQPDNAWVTLPSSTAVAFNTILSGSAPFTYRWRKDGIDLNNGTAQGYGAIIGATGPATILGGTANPVNVTSQGWYDCRIGNTCGTGYTSSAWLVVQPDAAPYYPIRFDSPVAPVVSAIGNTDAATLLIGGNYPRFFTSIDGVPFAIAPTGNNTWHSRNAPGSATANKSITIPISRYGVGEVCTLINTQGTGTTNVRLSFSASGGLSYTTTLVGGTHIRSHSVFQGPQATTSPLTSVVFDSGLTRLDKQRVLLPNSFRTRTLSSMTITDLGTDSTARAFVTGLTLAVRPPACGPADLGSVGGAPGDDGVLDNNDFIVFIDRYFSGDLSVDFGSAGGIAGPDGVLDNNDYIAFIDFFFAAC